jgi:alpha-D-ribose 1-methylphosphonate 5-triphosphate synthase subunit PhnG
MSKLTVREWRRMSREQRQDWLASHQPAEVKEFKRRLAKARWARAKDAAMRDLGLVKVRGAVSGTTYWE